MKTYEDIIVESNLMKITHEMKLVITKVIQSKGRGSILLKGIPEKLAAQELGITDIELTIGGDYVAEPTLKETQKISALVDTSQTPQEKLPNNVHITTRVWTDGFTGVIAAIKQKTARDDQVVFPADSHDLIEFGKALKKGEVLVRVSTPLTKNNTNEHRTIAKVNAATGKLAWIDSELYDETGKVKWERPLKLTFLTIDRDYLSYFNVW